MNTCVYTGNYLFEKLKDSDAYEVCFVWNRTANKMDGVVPVDLILDDLRQAHTKYVCVCMQIRSKLSVFLADVKVHTSMVEATQ